MQPSRLFSALHRNILFWVAVDPVINISAVCGVWHWGVFQPGFLDIISVPSRILTFIFGFIKTVKAYVKFLKPTGLNNERRKRSFCFFLSVVGIYSLFPQKGQNTLVL